MTENKSLDGFTDSVDISLSKIQEMVKNREAWGTAVHRAAKSLILGGIGGRRRRG